MDCSEAGCAIPTKPRILLAACGTYDACKFKVVHWKFAEWAAEIKVVITKSALRYHGTPRNELASVDENDWLTYRRPGVAMLHVELRNWADIMVIAPLSTNTLGKVINQTLLVFVFFYLHCHEIMNNLLYMFLIIML